MKARPTHTIKRGEDDYEVVMKADNVTALKALQLAMQDLAKQEELENQRKKDTPVESQNNDWNIDNGMQDVG